MAKQKIKKTEKDGVEQEELKQENAGAPEEEQGNESTEESPEANTPETGDAEEPVNPENETQDLAAQPEQNYPENTDAESETESGKDAGLPEETTNEESADLSDQSDVTASESDNNETDAESETKPELKPVVQKPSTTYGYSDVPDIMGKDIPLEDRLTDLAKNGSLPVSILAGTMLEYSKKMKPGNPATNAVIGIQANRDLFNIIRATLSNTDNKIIKVRLGLITTVFQENTETFTIPNMLKYERSNISQRERKSFRNLVTLFVQLSNLSTRAENAKNIDVKTLFAYENTILSLAEQSVLRKYFDL